MELKKGQIWLVKSHHASKNTFSSLDYTKTRPYVISNTPRPGSTFVTVVPLSEFRGKIESYQMYYVHNKPSIIHIENSRLVKTSSLDRYQGSLDEEAKKKFDLKLMSYFGVEIYSFRAIKKVKVYELTSCEVYVVIRYKTDRFLKFVLPLELLDDSISRDISSLGEYFKSIDALNLLFDEGMVMGVCEVPI